MRKEKGDIRMEAALKRIWARELEEDLTRINRALEDYLRVEGDLVAETGRFLLEAGGKRIRPSFVVLSSKLFSYDFDKVRPLAMAVELMHMASLVHDDVVDASLTRRGRPSVSARWGNEVAISTGSFLFAKVMDLVLDLEDPALFALFAKMCVQMTLGEIQQIRVAYNVEQSFRQYYYRISRKTGLLVAMSCQTGAMVSGATARETMLLRRFGHSLGIAFQIVDDILDLTADPRKLGKPCGGDIRQGIMTLPMIYAMESLPASQRDRFAEIFCLRDKDEALVAEALWLVKISDGIQRAQELANRYTERAQNCLSCFPKTRHRKNLQDLAEFVGKRKF
ncbi:MAG: polyprenyl synthetase family protein [Gracilibacteraceae bacterium]|nr:polyprenyl synthetase family protein [Gracilibacteraceae bacterium]